MAAALWVHLGHLTTPLLVELLRRLARNKKDWIGAYWAEQAALRVEDPQVRAMYGFDPKKDKPDPKLFEDLGKDPTFESLRAERSKVLASGFTARRAQPKVGRNDACPCGSGKKYKKCCAKNEDRISLSPVAGLTMREYRKRLHEFLDAKGLLSQHPADLAGLPFDELALEQLDSVFQVFVECERMELAERLLERIIAHPDVTDEERDNVRAYLVGFAHDWGHEELVARHVPKFLDPEKVPPYVQLGHALRHPNEKVLDLIEAECRAYVKDGERPPHDLAYELLATHPALGILLTRGALDARHPDDGWRLLDEVEWARDKLGAPPNDPYWAAWEAMLGEQRLAKASDAEKEKLRADLEQMRREAEEARAEAQVLVRELSKHQGELEDLEARAAEAEALAEERASLVDVEEQKRQETAARELRRKIRELEGRIREGQLERADLRRRAQEVTEAEPTEPVRTSQTPEEPLEDPGEDVGAHGLRIPVWTDKARSSLDKLPAKVASAAIAAAGALGAGRPEAWRHAKQLEGLHGLCSARVGIHHRLLFWMEEEGVLEVDEVVTREGLDRALAARR
ncbi:MAG: SEC-C metal-binding domain-containing protein [Sandaracinaceae bacterium]